MKNTPVDTLNPQPKATNIHDVGYAHIEHIWWALNVLQHEKRLLTQKEWDDITTYMNWIEEELEDAMWHDIKYWGDNEEINIIKKPKK